MADAPLSQVPRAVARRSLVGTPTRLTDPAVAATQALAQGAAARLADEDRENQRKERVAQLQMQKEVEIGLGNARALAMEETDPDRLVDVYNSNVKAFVNEAVSGMESEENQSLVDLYAAQAIHADQNALNNQHLRLKTSQQVSALSDWADSVIQGVRSGSGTPESIAAALQRIEATLTLPDGETDVSLLTPEQRNAAIRAVGQDVEISAFNAAMDAKDFEAAKSVITSNKYLSPEQEFALRSREFAQSSGEIVFNVFDTWEREQREDTFDPSEPPRVARRLLNEGKISSQQALGLYNYGAESKAALEVRRRLRARWRAFTEDRASVPDTAERKKMFEAFSEEALEEEILRLKDADKGKHPEDRMDTAMLQRQAIVNLAERGIPVPELMVGFGNRIRSPQNLEAASNDLEFIETLWTAAGRDPQFLSDWFDQDTMRLWNHYEEARFGSEPPSIGAQQRIRESALVGGQYELVSGAPRLTPKAAAIVAYGDVENLTTGSPSEASAKATIELFASMPKLDMARYIERGFNKSLLQPKTEDYATAVFGVDATEFASLRDASGNDLTAVLSRKIRDRAQSIMIQRGSSGPDALQSAFTSAWGELIMEQDVGPDMVNSPVAGQTFIGASPPNKYIETYHRFTGQANPDALRGEFVASAVGDRETGLANNIAGESGVRVREMLEDIFATPFWGERVDPSLFVPPKPGYLAPPGSLQVAPWKEGGEEGRAAIARVRQLQAKYGWSDATVRALFSTDFRPTMGGIAVATADALDIDLEDAWALWNDARFGDVGYTPVPFELYATESQSYFEGNKVGRSWMLSVLEEDASVPTPLQTRDGQVQFWGLDRAAFGMTASTRDPDALTRGPLDDDTGTWIAQVQAASDRRARNIGVGLVQSMEPVYTSLGEMYAVYGSMAPNKLESLEERAKSDAEASAAGKITNDEAAARAAQNYRDTVDAVTTMVESGVMGTEQADELLDELYEKAIPPTQAEQVMDMGVRIKPGVSLDGMRPELLDAVRTYRKVMSLAGIQATDMAITGGVADHKSVQNYVNRKGGDKSLHAVGYAVDLRARNISKERGQRLAAKMQDMLGSPYFVLFETRRAGQDLPQNEWHFHISYKTDESLDLMKKYFSGKAGTPGGMLPRGYDDDAEEKKRLEMGAY